MSKSNNEIKLTDQQIEYIARYISKEPSELSEIQKIQVEKWRKEIPFFENEFQNYSKLWQESNRFGQKLGQNYSPNIEKGWQKLSQQIKEYEATKTVAKEWVKPATIPQNETKSVSIWKEIGKIAAILIIGLGLGWWINSIQTNSSNLTLADSSQIIVHQHSDTPLVLPDGSKIWLNKNATISYTADFGKFESFDQNNQKRNLKLKGEAFFDIARDEKHPFTIDVEGKAEVEVLGTSFNINPTNEKIEVTVTSGKVNFTTNIPSKENIKTNTTITLVKGEKGILYKNNESHPDSLPSLVRFERNDDVNYLAWLNHRLVFENMQMQEVINKVEIYYNIRLKLENSSLKECRFTGTFDQTPLNDVLETLSFGANLQIKKSDSTTYLLSGSGCR